MRHRFLTIPTNKFYTRVFFFSLVLLAFPAVYKTQLLSQNDKKSIFWLNWFLESPKREIYYIFPSLSLVSLHLACRSWVPSRNFEQLNSCGARKTLFFWHCLVRNPSTDDKRNNARNCVTLSTHIKQKTTNSDEFYDDRDLCEKLANDFNEFQKRVLSKQRPPCVEIIMCWWNSSLWCLAGDGASCENLLHCFFLFHFHTGGIFDFVLIVSEWSHDFSGDSR